jgi:cytochrome oxidase assembly protein ShyY1
MFKNLTKPRWIALTAFLLIMIYLFIRLSDWQFDRYNTRIQNNEITTTALNSEPIKLTDLSQVSDLKDWQKVSIKGEFMDSDAKLLRRQYLESSLGFWVITPLKLDNDKVILVNRGWIPIAESSTSQQEIPSSPQGDVTIIGYVQTLKDTRSEPEDLPLNQINYLNSTHFSSQPLSTNFLQLASMSPMDNQVAIIPLPELSNGPHFSYAIQWILFALMLPIGWYVLLKNENK